VSVEAKVIRTRRGAWTAALGLTAALTGCVVDDEDGALVILQAQPLSDSCEINTSEAISLSRGVIDMSMGTQYQLNLLVANNMKLISGIRQYQPQDARLDTTTVRLTRAIIEYRALDQISVSFPEQLRVPLSSPVSPGGRSAFGVEVLTPAMIQDLRTSPEFIVRGADGQVRPARTEVKLLVNVKVEGETLDGKSVGSNEFTFPLTVCNGCLVQVPPDAVSVEAGVQPNCLLIGGEDVETPDDLCFVGQDAPVDCRVCTLFAVDDFARQLCQPPF
jgi:hypothetical protein